MEGIDKRFPGVKALDQARLQLTGGTVHALLGENGAGKSTLMKCLFGIYKKDAGSIRLEGKPVAFAGPKHALDSGVAMVHQELNQVLQRNVMENMWLGRFPMSGPFVNARKMYGDTRRIFSELGIDIDPRQKIGGLSVSRRQMAEIAKAVSYNAKILVLDEPTSSLTDNEVGHLFRIIEKLTAAGVGVIYISHRLDEIMRVSDVITIMRDGLWIATRSARDFTISEVIKLMVNREMSNRFPPRRHEPGEALLRISNLSGKYEPACRNVSFDLRAGEVLGVAGLVGSRRTELLATLFGANARESGEVLLRGKPIRNKKPYASMRHGFAYLTEERRATGIFPQMNVTFNSVIANIKNYGRLLLSGRAMNSDADWVIDAIKVKTPGKRTQIKSLSGGNQQKVIIGRWLLTKPEILLLDEPTRGVDVGAKYEIYQMILELAGQGKAVLMVSSEMPELLGICDRILVMSGGRLSGVAERGRDFGGIEGEQETIMRLAAQYC
jgi:methyl-galactoside transport system ATP-binding protein